VLTTHLAKEHAWCFFEIMKWNDFFAANRPYIFVTYFRLRLFWSVPGMILSRKCACLWLTYSCYMIILVLYPACNHTNKQMRKICPILSHCVVVLFWSTGIMGCMLFLSWESFAHALGSVESWRLQVPSINRLGKTKAACFSCKLCFIKTISILR